MLGPSPHASFSRIEHSDKKVIVSVLPPQRNTVDPNTAAAAYSTFTGISGTTRSQGQLSVVVLKYPPSRRAVIGFEGDVVVTVDCSVEGGNVVVEFTGGRQEFTLGYCGPDQHKKQSTRVSQSESKKHLLERTS